MFQRSFDVVIDLKSGIAPLCFEKKIKKKEKKKKKENAFCINNYKPRNLEICSCYAFVDVKSATNI